MIWEEETPEVALATFVSLQVRRHISIAVDQLNVPLSLRQVNVGQKKHIIHFKSVTGNEVDACFCKKKNTLRPHK